MATISTIKPKGLGVKNKYGKKGDIIGIEYTCEHIYVHTNMH